MKKLGIILAALLVAVSFSFTSCDLFRELLAINGKVVNIKADPEAKFYTTKSKSLTLVGAIVTYTSTADSAKKYTAVVQDDGTYKVEGVPSGKYTISGVQSGWTFIPTTMVVSGMTQSAPNLLAFASDEAGTLTVVMTWENKATDMDLHMKVGTMGTADTVNHVYHAAKTLTTGNFTATLDRDITSTLLQSQPLVETITLSATGGIISPNDTANWNSAANVQDNTTFRFYIDAYQKGSGITGSTSVSPAGATVHIFKSTEHYGSFFAPFNTEEQTMRVLKICFDGSASNNFTVFTDIQTEPAGTFRGLELPLIGKLVSSIQ